MALETESKHLPDDKIGPGVAAVFADETKGFYVVTESDAGSIVGGLMVTFEWSDWRNAWFWWIQSVYILPEARSTGLYRRMYDFVKQRAADGGNVCGFRLYVETENTHAQKVYYGVGMSRSHYLMYEEEV
jgi:GNAT superfamily N-acetyltransferase